jgi:uncharacterized membrane-anchored protein
MNKYIKLIILLIVLFPLAAVLSIPFLALNVTLGGINPEFLIYNHEYGLEALVGSAMVWGFCLSFAFCCITAINIFAKRKFKFWKNLLYFLAILFLEIVLYLLLRDTFILNWF